MNAEFLHEAIATKNLAILIAKLAANPYADSEQILKSTEALMLQTKTLYRAAGGHDPDEGIGVTPGVVVDDSLIERMVKWVRQKP